MPSAPLRIRPADDPEHPGAVVIERFEPLKLKPLYDHRPMGWVVIAWHPSRAALAESAEQVKASARERTEQADALLAQLEPPQVQAVAEGRPPTMLEAFEAFGRRLNAEMYQEIANATGLPVHGHMPHPLANQRSTGPTPPIPECVAEVLAQTLATAWEAVVNRVTVERPRS